MSIINYAVEIITEKTAFTNTSYGLVAGTFRYITGQPGYDGTPTYPTWEDTTNNTHIWYEGWLIKDRMSNPTREVDLSQTGDYGTFSGFNFSIRNDLLLWKYVRDNAIYFTNRDVKLYCIIDGVFYQIWGGVISNNPYDEIDYQFTCSDSFKKIHKPFPPLIVNPDSFDGASDRATNKPMQVVIGDCTYVKLQVIVDEPVLSTVADSSLMYGARFYAKACGVSHYATVGLTYPTLKMYNRLVEFGVDDLVGKYIYVTKGGGDPDTDQLILIRSNTVSSGGYSTLEIDAPFDFTNETLFNQKYSYDPLQGTHESVHYGYYATTLNNCIKGDSTWGAIYQIRSGSWIHYSDIDLYNYGTGCNLIKVELSFKQAGIMNVRLNSPTGDIIGQCPYTGTHPAWYIYEVGIEKQYVEHADVYLTFDTVSGLDGLFLSMRPTHNPSDIDTWWFSIVSMPSTHIISTNEIKEIVRDPISNLPYVFVYNEQTLAMEPAPYVVLDQIADTTGSLGHPEFAMFTSRMTKDGAVKYMVPVVPKDWELRVDENGYIDNGPNRVNVLSSNIKAQSGFNLCNRSQAASAIIHFPETKASNIYNFSILAQYPPEAIQQEFDEIFFGVDFVANATKNIRVFADFEILDAYGNTVEFYKKEDDLDLEWYYPIDESCTTNSLAVYTLPDEYYRNGGYRLGTIDSLWPLVAENGDGEDTPMKNLLRIPDEIADTLRDGTSTNIVKINIYITSSGTGGTSENFTGTVSICEAGFVGYKAINPDKDDFFVRIKGETLDGVESNTVYKAFRLMLEKYDGILPADIDYTNLPYIRDDGWTVGRVIEDQKNMYEYLRSLAESSFVAIFPSRTGKRVLRAWREPYLKWVTDAWVDQEPTPLSLPIIRESITQWTNTDIAKLYNDFYIVFDWNPGAAKYINFVFVTKVSEAAFPSTSGQTWKTFVGGVSDGSYADAKIWWDACSESYLRCYALQPFPKEKQEQAWFTTSSIFNGLTSAKVSTQDAAFKFMDNCVRWLSRQKTEVKIATPITSASVITELCQTCSFSDSVYTDGETRTGWVTGVEFDLKNAEIRLGYMLEPEDIVIDNLIIERGIILNQDTHVESGTQTDQVEDGQGRI